MKHTLRIRPRMIWAFVCLVAVTFPQALKAGEPAPMKKVPIEKLCPVPGLYQQYDLSGFTIITCHLVSNATCIYLPGPCPLVEAPGAPVESVPAPPGLDIPEGQQFFGRYDTDGTFIVTFVKEMKVGSQAHDDGTYSITITYK